jgi:hypothetical protein
MSKLETNTIDTVSGTSTLQVGSTNTSTITLGVSGDTVNIPSGVTIANSGTATGFGGANTPFFQVIKTSDQSISHANSTKLTWDSAVTESSSAFDLTNNKFTATVAGRYLFAVRVGFYDSDNNLKRATVYNYKNNSGYRTNDFFMANGGIRNAMVYDTWIEDVAVNDYFEVYVLQNTTDSGACNVEGGSNFETSFSGFKLI